MRNNGNAFVRWLTGPIPLSIVLAFVVGAIFILLAGYSPVEAYLTMAEGSILSPSGITNTIQRAIPLVGMAMATAVAFRSGILNIGTEGQMIMGGLVGGIVALYMPGPGIIVMICAILGGIAGGALWALVSAVLQFWPGVPILITSLLLSYPARFFSSWMIRYPLKDQTSQIVATEQIRLDVQIPMLLPLNSGLGQSVSNGLGRGNLVSTIGSSINWSFVIILLVVVGMAYVNRNTIFGYESGINGINPRFIEYGGGHERKLTLQVMTLSGGIAGLVGVLLTIGAPETRLIDGALLSSGYAWTGLMVALLAMYRPFAVLAAGAFFGAIMAGASAMSRGLGMSPQIASVIQGVVIILIVFRVTLPNFKERRRSIAREHASDHADALQPTDETVAVAEGNAN